MILIKMMQYGLWLCWVHCACEFRTGCWLISIPDCFSQLMASRSIYKRVHDQKGSIRTKHSVEVEEGILLQKFSGKKKREMNKFDLGSRCAAFDCWRIAIQHIHSNLTWIVKQRFRHRNPWQCSSSLFLVMLLVKRCVCPLVALPFASTWTEWDFVQSRVVAFNKNS